MEDDFAEYKAGLTAPAEAAEIITPSDTGDLGFVSRGLYVGGTGNVAVKMKKGQTVTFFNVQAGSFYPIRVAQVLASGTTATNLIAVR